MRILLVDDTESIRYTVRQVLKFEKFDCEVAESVDEALVLLNQAQTQGNAFDLVLLDLMMPGESPQLLLNSAVRKPRTQVYIFSASSTAQEQAQKLGADGCISKPFTIDELVATLKKIAAGQRAEVELTSLLSAGSYADLMIL